ncbi:MAG: GLPGLI family protein [Bacteroidetes bacterium]|nr:GLPGLI family protein [Bacteroidota bacterium]
MKKILLLSLLSLFILRTFAQAPDSAFSAIHYSFTFMIDTTNPNRLYNENMVLFMGKNSSSFESFDKISQMSNSDNNTFGSVNSNSQFKKRTIATVMYRFSRENSFFIYENELKEYLMEDTIKIKWAIIDSLKIIEGMECQKAFCQFRGREYDVWFTSSIPLSYGPWKLGGLPGLIIEAHDSKNQVNINFTGLENLSAKPHIIELPKNVTLISKKEFKKIREAIANDPIGYLNNMMGIKVQRPGGEEAPRILRKPNNTIELTKD